MSSLSILLTEDDLDVARYLVTVLKSLGHRVAGVARNGLQSVQMAEELHPDLVIMDLDLPGMNGVSAARKILEKRSLPLIISTGRTDSEALESTGELDVKAFLVKPFSAVQLKSAIAVAMSQHQKQAEARQKINELSGALEAVQDKADAGALTKERLQTLGLTPREAEVMAWVAQGKSRHHPRQLAPNRRQAHRTRLRQTQRRKPHRRRGRSPAPPSKTGRGTRQNRQAVAADSIAPAHAHID